MSIMHMSNMQSAIYTSIFSRKKTDNENSGYWVDAITGEQFGSELFKLERSYLTGDVLEKTVEYVKDSLAWLVTKGLAKQIQVSTEKSFVNRLLIKITVDGAEVGFELPA